ncbi:MAG TPA: hypothetical protein VL688_09595 [Verrucomicrobiae bacterium]|jgi:hypothetical protein|nr:hypothetical protein [Verrucomicrobiae bacterium]
MNIKEYYWPDLQDLAGTKKASDQGAAACFLVGGATAIIAFCQSMGYFNIMPGLDSGAYLDAFIFLILGIGTLRKMRIAALAAMVLYFFEAFYTIKLGNRVNFMMFILIMQFINGVRGTFSYHELVELGAGAAPVNYQALDPITGLPRPALAGVPGAEVPASAAPAPGNKIGDKLQVILVLLLLIGGGFFAVQRLGLSGGKPGKSKWHAPSLSHHGHAVVETAAPERKPPAAKAAAAAPASAPAPAAEADMTGAKKFHLKNGQTVRGKVVYEDDVYYTVQTASGDQIVIREDVDSIS